MPRSEQVGVAVIGAGPWGVNHLRVLAGEPGCRPVAVVDPDPAAHRRARELAPGIAVHDRIEPVLADRAVEAVVIATPSSTHAAIARAALRANKHVLVEKPLALALADATELAALAEERRRVAMVGHLMVFHPAVIRVRELLGSGVLGRFHYLHAIRANLGRIRHDENVLWSLGPHDLSVIDALLGQSPVNVSARGQSVLQPGIEDVVFLTLRFAGGEMAHVHLSWLHPRKERRLTLVCAQKMVEFDDVAPEKLRIYDKGFERPPEFTQFAEYLTLRDGDVFIPRLAMEEPLRNELRHFLGCIADGGAPVADFASGVRVIATLDAAQRSLEADGAPVSIAAAKSPSDPGGSGGRNQPPP